MNFFSIRDTGLQLRDMNLEWKAMSNQAIISIEHDALVSSTVITKHSETTDARKYPGS
jgi:hypothetical protein